MPDKGQTSFTGPFPELAATTDAAGKFRLANVPSGSWTAYTPGPRAFTTQSARVTVQPGEKQESLEITASLWPTLRCRVLGVNGQPLATLQGITLESWRRPSAGKLAKAEEPLSLDAQGNASTTVRQLGEALFAVFIEGEGSFASPWIKVEDGKDIPLEMRLQPFQRVAGKVLEKGARSPVRGAAVRAEPVASATDPTLGRRRETVSDTKGEFVLPSLAPAAYDLLVAADGFTPAQPVRVTLKPEEKPSDLLIELTRVAPAK